MKLSIKENYILIYWKILIENQMKEKSFEGLNKKVKRKGLDYLIRLINQGELFCLLKKVSEELDCVLIN